MGISNAKALELAAEYSVNGKALVKPALESIVRAKCHGVLL
jgi:hypothetical protein